MVSTHLKWPYKWVTGVITPILSGTGRNIPGLGYVVNSHGDRKSLICGVVGPLPKRPFCWLINGGYYTIDLQTGGIPAHPFEWNTTGLL